MFTQPWLLSLFALLLPLGLVLFLSWRAFRRFEQTQSLFLFHSRRPTWLARAAQMAVWLLIFSLVIVGLADPVVSWKVPEVRYRNVRLYFVVDVSRSMIYAEDVKPNRLAAVKRELLDFYQRTDGQYEVSIVPFAGQPNVYYCPPSYSSSVIVPLITNLDQYAAPTRGTDLLAAVTEVRRAVKSDVMNVVVILSDGGREESGNMDRGELRQAVLGISGKVYTVGVGGREPCVLFRRAKDGGFAEYVKVDGQISYSQLDEGILRDVATWGGGQYMYFSEPGELYTFLDDILRQNRVAEVTEGRYKQVSLQLYMYALAAVCLWLTYFGNKAVYGRDVIRGRSLHPGETH